MIRIFLLDDEPYVIDWLEDIIERHLSGRYRLLVSKCASSVEALDILRHDYYDLIVSDIRMPGLDGLELLRGLREKRLTTKLIFLTAFSEFDYVYTATRELGATYLLKSEDDEAILEQISRSIDALVREEDEQKEAMAKESMLAVYRDRSALQTYERGQSGLAELLCGPGQASPPARLRPLLVRLENKSLSREELKGREIEYGKELHLRVLTAVPGLLEGLRIFCVDTALYLLFLIPRTSPSTADAAGLSREQYRGLLERAQDQLFEEQGLESGFYLFEEDCDVAAALRLFESLRSYRPEGPPAIGQVRELSAAELRGTDAGQNVLLPLSEQEEALFFRSQMEQMDGLRAAFVQGTRYELLDRAQRLKLEAEEPFIRGFQVSWLTQQRVELELRRLLMEQIARLKERNKQSVLSEALRKTEEDSRQLGSYGERLRSWLEFAARLQNELLKEESGEHYLIAALKQYIEAHLGENLSLKALAEQFHYNPSYVSRFFKQETEHNLFEYINERKMRSAAKLLTEGRLGVRETARRVGVLSPQYFSVLFKRVNGLSPQQYLKRYRSEAVGKVQEENK